MIFPWTEEHEQYFKQPQKYLSEDFPHIETDGHGYSVDFVTDPAFQPVARAGFTIILQWPMVGSMALRRFWRVHDSRGQPEPHVVYRFNYPDLWKNIKRIKEARSQIGLDGEHHAHGSLVLDSLPYYKPNVQSNLRYNTGPIATVSRTKINEIRRDE